LIVFMPRSVKGWAPTGGQRQAGSSQLADGLSLCQRQGLRKAFGLADATRNPPN
jgi:hypothetical protein